jgi:hypothetical protein
MVERQRLGMKGNEAALWAHVGVDLARVGGELRRRGSDCSLVAAHSGGVGLELALEQRERGMAVPTGEKGDRQVGPIAQ